MGAIQSTIIAGMVVSLTIFTFLLFIDDTNFHYGSSIDKTELQSLEKMEELTGNVTGMRDTAVDETAVDTQESEASFASNLWTISKFVFTGGALQIVESMISDFVDIVGLPRIFYAFLSSTLIIILIVATSRSVLGR